MSRVQLSINVGDLDTAVAFYSRLFGVEPAKLRPGYANLAITDPPLKLVLNAPGNGPAGSINHLGVEVESSDAVHAADTRLTAVGLAPVPEPDARCCYALQDKIWLHDPDQVPWEFYTVREHIETP
jgi:catechol 2,3-dioxygenase-like lactoylglutathione lyase family enzyme